MKLVSIICLAAILMLVVGTPPVLADDPKPSPLPIPTATPKPPPPEPTATSPPPTEQPTSLPPPPTSTPTPQPLTWTPTVQVVATSTRRQATATTPTIIPSLTPSPTLEITATTVPVTMTLTPTTLPTTPADAALIASPLPVAAEGNGDSGAPSSVLLVVIIGSASVAIAGALLVIYQTVSGRRQRLARAQAEAQQIDQWVEGRQEQTAGPEQVQVIALAGGNPVLVPFDTTAASIGSEMSNPAKAVDGLVEQLTGRELQVLQLITDGLTNQEIAERLVIAENTVKKHVNSIYSKLGVSHRAEAVARARELGIN